MRAINTIECSSWTTFRTRVSDLCSSGEFVFRGHADWPLDNTAKASGRWLLQSQYERWFVKFSSQFPPRELREGENFDPDYPLGMRLETFRSCLSDSDRSTADYDEDELSALGRHFGLVTRLLDWTRNPLKAAFFAFEGYVKARVPGTENGWSGGELQDDLPSLFIGSVSVWGLRDADGLVGEEFRLSLKCPTDALGMRQAAQEGLFTELRSVKHHDLESWLNSRQASGRLTRLTVPGSDAIDALRDLNRQGISYATMFPGPEGAAMQANIPRGIWGSKW